jgi:hypothetical protein
MVDRVAADRYVTARVDRASFMRLRDQREPPREPVLDIVGDDEDRAEATTTDLHP